MKNTREPRYTGRVWPKSLIFFVVIVTWYGLLQVLPLDKWLLNMLLWVEGCGYWGPVLFSLMYIPSCVLMFPDVLPNAAAGAIWGVGIGAVAVSFGRMFGSTMTFLLTRSIAGRWSERRIAADPRMSAIANAVQRQGFRIVLLLRLCPLFPVIMLNYTLGMTRISFPAYALATLIGMIPRTLVVAYVGSGARSLMELAGGKEVNLIAHPALYWGGLLLSLITVIVIAVKTRQIINEALQGDSKGSNGNIVND